MKPHYVGSCVNAKKRISSHKQDLVRGRGKDCGFCEHWARHHRGNPQDLSMWQIYFLDPVDDLGAREDDYPRLRKLEERWMVKLGSLTSLDPVGGFKKRDDARPGARHYGT